MQTFRYRLHDTTGDDLGNLKHPAPNVEPGDVLTLPEGREGLVTARVETKQGGPWNADVGQSHQGRTSPTHFSRCR